MYTHRTIEFVDGSEHGDSGPKRRKTGCSRMSVVAMPIAMAVESRHADFETRCNGNRASIEPDRSRPPTIWDTLGEPTRGRHPIHEPPGRTATGTYDCR